MRFMGFCGVRVEKGVGLAFMELEKAYKNTTLQAQARKGEDRFESVSRTKFLNRQKKPLRMWQKKSREVMDEMDSIVERGL